MSRAPMTRSTATRAPSPCAGSQPSPSSPNRAPQPTAVLRTILGTLNRLACRTRHIALAAFALLAISFFAPAVDAQTDTTAPTVTSIRFYATEAAAIAGHDTNGIIAEVDIGIVFYVDVQFSERMQQDLTNNDRPNIGFRATGRIPAFSNLVNQLSIIPPAQAFTGTDNECRSEQDTSRYICNVVTTAQSFKEGTLVVLVPHELSVRVGAIVMPNLDLAGNSLQMTASESRTLNAAPELGVTSVTHYPSLGDAQADPATNPLASTAMWETREPIYSIIQFSGPNLEYEISDDADARPQIFYQIGSADRVQFQTQGATIPVGGTRAPPGNPPRSGACRILSFSPLQTDAQFWCNYTPTFGESGTYQIIVGGATRTDAKTKTLGEDWAEDAGITLAVPAGELEITNMTVNEGDGSVSIPVVLDGDISGGFTVDVSTADGTATAGQDYTAITGHTLSFAGTDGETQSFTLSLTDDTTVENNETLTLSLSNLAGTTYTIDITDTDTVTITDNDSLFSAVIADQTYVVNAAVNLTLPPATGGTIPYTYTLTRNGGTPVLPNGLTFDPAARTISGASTQEFGGAAGATLVYTVTDAASPPFTAALTFSFFFTVNPAPSMTLTPTAPTLTEGSTTTYTAVLGSPPTATVTVAITSDNTDVTPTPAALTFTTSDWSTAQTVTITAAEDDDAADDLATLAHDANGGGYGSVTANLTVTVTDNDRTDSEELNKQILSRATQAIASGTLAAMGARVEAAVGGFGSFGGTGAVGNFGETPKMAYRFGGQSSMRGLLQAHGKTMLEGEMDYEQLLDGASFVLPLSAAGDAGGGKLGALSLWGGTDFSNLDGDADNIDWEGEVVSFHLGVDAPVGNNMLAGLALSLNTASFDYTNDGTSGDYEYSTTNLHPYFGYRHNEKLNFWGAAGFGQGEIEIKAEDADKNATDTAHLSLAGGFSTHLLDLPNVLSGGETTLNIKGDVSQATVDVEAADNIAAQEISSNRIRLLLAGKSRRQTASGGVMTPSLESGLRVDGGDGETGAGLELNAGIHYTNPNGVSVQGGIHTLLGHDGYSESGADFIVRLAPRSGRGLSLSLQPVWGETRSTADRLWDDGINELSGDDKELRSRMDSEVGYGLAATMLGSVGVLTPYTGMTTVDGGVSHVRLGSRFTGGTGLRLNLEGVRENGSDDASHTVLLRGELVF